jgi:hypothetical protein
MSHLTRGPMFCMGIGSKAIDDGRRHDNVCVTNQLTEAPA